MRFSKKYMLFLLRVVLLAINNIRKHPELSTRILEFGFDEVRLDYGLTLHKLAETAFYTKETKYSNQYVVSKKVQDKIDELYRFYVNWVNMLRLRLKRNKEALSALHLNGPTPKRMSDLIAEATHLFTNALTEPSIADKIASLGLTQEKLDLGMEKVNAVTSEDQVQEAMKGVAQDSTDVRNTVFIDLHDYWLEMKQALKNVTTDRPQLREIAKIPEYSPEYKRKLRNDAKAAAEPPVVEPPFVEPPVVEPPVEEPQPVEVPVQPPVGGAQNPGGNQ